MQVICPSCQSQISSDDMNLSNMVAKCRHCHALVDLRDWLPPDDSRPSRERLEERAPVPMPPGLSVDDSGDGLKIFHRWYSSELIFLAFFCVAWDSFLVYWYSMAWGGNAPWLVVVFPVAHLAVGVGLTYATLAGFVNRTVISVGQETLMVRHGPLPWTGNRALPIDTLDQLYTQQVRREDKRGVQSSYTVCAATKDGRKVVLVRGLPDLDEALFIEQRVEAHLGMKDRPVPGEVPRPGR